MVGAGVGRPAEPALFLAVGGERVGLVVASCEGRRASARRTESSASGIQFLMATILPAAMSLADGGSPRSPR